MFNTKRKLSKINTTRQRRIYRVRNKVKGTATKPRLCFCKSNKNIYVQLIDDENHKTIAGIGTLSKENKDMKKSKESAKKLGEQIAKIAIEKKIERVVLDRGRYKYHGLIAQLANAAREVGLQF